MQNSTGWDTSTNTGELVPIEKYSGFYVGRYEAGTSEVTLSGNVKWENASTGSSNSQGWGWQNQSFTSSKVTEGKFAFNRIFESFEELETELFDYVNWYNNIRIHSSLNYLTPIEYKKVSL